MFNLLDGFDGSPEASLALRDSLDQHVRTVGQTRGRGNRSLVGLAEAEVRTSPSACIHFDPTGLATVRTSSGEWTAGRFEMPSVGELRARAHAARALARPESTRLRLWVLDGVSPATDIGALQAVAPPNSLFQVASQFNCLESPGPYIAEIADYFHDPTQGPRASISTFPGTLVRHYAAPHVDGSRFVQRSEGPQLDLLAAVCPPGVAAVKSGYLRSADVSDPEAFALELESRFDQIRIGVHDEIEVVLGYDWDGGVDESRTSTIAQVFTSTLALGLYSRAGGDDELSIPICRQLQRAAYLGTLLAAAALGKARVVLTLIGGGVFGNPVPIIWETILWAADDVEPLLHRDLTVVVNGRNLRHAVPSATLSETARARGGAMIRFNGESCTIIPKRSV